VSEGFISNFSGKISESCDCLLLLLNNVEPAQPFFFAAVRPERRITRPKPFGFLIGLPIGERSLNCRG
jgi:hypothetical protein